MKRWLALMLGALWGCTCGDTGARGLHYACATDSDCVSGYACIQGVCAVPGPDDAGGGDAGEVPDGGVLPDSGPGPDGGAPPPLDAGPPGDGGRPRPDGGPTLDSGTPPDAGRGADAGPADGGGSADGGVLDAGVRDAGGVDAGPRDAGAPDAGGCNLSAVNCAQAACAGVACASNGFICSGGACVCSGNGGTPQAAETLCRDGFDNDCNGLIDCADPNCSGAACGSFGLTCVSGACVCVPADGGSPENPESTCYDGIDNDCNGLIDCQDPACSSNNSACDLNFIYRGCLTDAGCGFTCDGLGVACDPTALINNCCSALCGTDSRCAPFNNATCAPLGDPCSSGGTCCSAGCTARACADNPSPHALTHCLPDGGLADVCAPSATDFLQVGCDACVTNLCDYDSYCCSVLWDIICVGEADQLCAGRCR